MAQQCVEWVTACRCSLCALTLASLVRYFRPLVSKSTPCSSITALTSSDRGSGVAGTYSNLHSHSPLLNITALRLSTKSCEDPSYAAATSTAEKAQGLFSQAHTLAWNEETQTREWAHFTGGVPFIVAPFAVAPLVAAAEHLTAAGLWQGGRALGALGSGSPDTRTLLWAVGNAIGRDLR